MKNHKAALTLLSIYTFLVCLACNNNVNEQSKVVEKKTELPKVAVLGMLHFVSKNNTVSQKFTQVNNDQRQEEIKTLIRLLKEYRPTKIAVERPYRSEKELNGNYRAYLNGTYSLNEEETDQIAFRLAKELSHQQLYLAYSPVTYDFDATVTFAKQHGQTYLIDSILENAKELALEYDKIAEKGTIRDAVFYLNTDKAIDKNHLGYILLSQVGDKQHGIGADAVGDWYTSNIKIFENIRQIIDSNSDRILVIYGQGHSKILNQLIDDSPEMELVRINEYLK